MQTRFFQKSKSKHFQSSPRRRLLTFLSSSPWEMFSDNMKPDTRWWIGPASPQWGRSTNMWKPLCLCKSNIFTKTTLKPFVLFCKRCIEMNACVSSRGFFCVINECSWAIPAQVVEHRHVGIGVVQVVRVRWVVFFCPVFWQRAVQIEDELLRFGLVVHAVEADHLWTHTQQQDKNTQENQDRLELSWRDAHVLQEEIQLRMTARVDRDFKQRHEDVLQHLLEISQLLLCSVNITGGIEQWHHRDDYCLKKRKKERLIQLKSRFKT